MNQTLFSQPVRLKKPCLVEVLAGYIWDRIWRSRVRLTLMLMVCAALGWFGWPDHAYPEGSRSLYPSAYPGGGSRANLDFQPGQLYMGKVRRSGFLYVYAQAGEYILLGSRNRSDGGDVFIYNPQDFGTPGNEIYNATTPGTPEFRCSTGSTQPGTHYSGGTLGTASTRVQELAGPNSADNTTVVSNGFAPCAYQAPVSGVYGVLFNPATGGGGPNGVIDPPALSNNSASVWDVTVRPDAASTTDINGRLFTYAFIGFTGGNSRPVYSTHYYVTNDGFRYAQDLRGLDPNGYALYANTFGFLDNGQPLFKNLRGNEALITTLPPGVATQTAQFPIFFTDVSPTNPDAAEINRVLDALSIPLTPPTPTVTAVSFTGYIGGSRTTPGVGGTLQFTTTDTISYMIIISRDGVDYNPENVSNRTLTGIALTGTHMVPWDGKDNSGVNFPASATPYPFHIFGHNGNVHFPIIDAENNPGGGPTITRLNGPDPGDRTVYFDDRGYRTSSGTLVGNLNGTLCPTGTPAAPAPPVSLLGLDSSINYRLWQAGGNSNTDCAANAGWGDAKGLNLWTFYSTPQEISTLVIDPIIVDVATAVSAPSTATSGSPVQGTFSFANNGNSAALNVTYNMAMTPDLGAVTFANLPGGVTAVYTDATGFVTLGGLPTTLDAGQMFLGMAFSYTAPAAGPVIVNTGINTTSPQESYLPNNTATSSTGIGATDVLTTVSLPAAAVAGTTVSGTFSFANFGVNAASGVTYGATIGSVGNFPASVTFTSLPTGVIASYNNTNGQITLSGMPGTLGSGVSLGFGFNYPAPVSGSVTLNTSVTTTSNDANPTNNSATGTTSVSAAADLAITKTDGVSFVAAGGNLTYTIVITNAGPSNTVGASVTDTLPAFLTSVSWSCTATAGSSCGVTDGSGNINTNVNLLSGGRATFIVNAILSAGATGSLVNTAGVAAPGGVMDPNAANNSATDADTIVGTADLWVTKTDGRLTYAPGSSLVYTVSVGNSGPSNVLGARVQDTMPLGTTGIWTAVFAGGASGNGSGTGNITEFANIPAGGSIIYTVTVTIPASYTGNLVNTVTVSAPAGVTDSNEANNTATDTNTPTDPITPSSGADLTITKASNPHPYVPGAPFTYTVVVSNLGPGDVTRAEVEDALPAACSAFTWHCVASGAGATCGTPNGTGDIDALVTLPAGTHATFTVTGTIPGGTTGNLANTATVTAPAGTEDPVPGNNSATDSNVSGVVSVPSLSQWGMFLLGVILLFVGALRLIRLRMRSGV